MDQRAGKSKHFEENLMLFITRSLIKDEKDYNSHAKNSVSSYILDNYKVNKMVRRVLIMCFLALAWCSDSNAQNDELFTIYLVRHSEKDYTSENTSDLPLSTCGKQRSIALSSFLDDVHLEAIYSTDYTRAKNTAIPTAETKDIEITLYNGQDIESFSHILLDNQQDVLVVGHSNTTGVLAGLLANQEIGDLDLDIYDRIYQVVICGESRHLHLFHSSFECVK